MNKKLHALMIKLKWQLDELQQELTTNSKQLAEIEAQLYLVLQRVNKASAPPTVILPEKEIASLHFIMVQQQQVDELKSSQSALITQLDKLNTKKIRLKTELKMLEKHQDRHIKSKIQQDLSDGQNKSDEWIVQRRTNA